MIDCLNATVKAVSGGRRGILQLGLHVAWHTCTCQTGGRASRIGTSISPETASELPQRSARDRNANEGNIRPNFEKATTFLSGRIVATAVQLRPFTAPNELMLSICVCVCVVQSYLEPVYFYIYTVFSLQAVYVIALYLTAWLLSGSWLAGTLSGVWYLLNR